MVQAEIDRSAYPDLGLNLQLIDVLGWIVPTESFSYSGLTPIKAIQEIAAAGGGFVYSEANSQAITIKPLYKKTFWDSMNLEDYDILLPESIVTELSTDYETYPDYNGNYRGDDLMYFSAKTRRFNIENASWFKKDIHLVFSVSIQDIAEIITTVSSAIEKRGGIGKVEIKEISIFHMLGMMDLRVHLYC